MRKKLIPFLLIGGLLSLTVFSCGSAESDEQVMVTERAENQKDQPEDEVQADPEDTSEIKKTDAVEIPEEDIDENQSDDSFSFAEFENLDFLFSSGAGAWSTTMQIHADGSFEGQYHDTDMGSGGEGYPNGTVYQSDFRGQFTTPVKVNDYTYSMQIARMDYEKEIGQEVIRDGVRYCYTDAYGLEEAQDILIYLPGTPLADLSEEFLIWVNGYDLTENGDIGLPFYALNNEANEEGFVGQDIVANIKETLQMTETYTDSLGQSIEHDLLSQAELNEQSQWMYDEWDYVLNELWRVLKRILDTEQMDALTDEQRAWIAEKEQTVAVAGAECEGGSIQPMVMNLRAAEMTKERVYELMEYLE